MSDVTPLGREVAAAVAGPEWHTCCLHSVAACTAGATGCCQAQPSTAEFLLHLSLLENYFESPVTDAHKPLGTQLSLRLLPLLFVCLQLANVF